MGIGVDLQEDCIFRLRFAGYFGVKCITAPTLALLAIIPFCAVSNVVAIHMNYDIVFVSSFYLWELQTTDGIFTTCGILAVATFLFVLLASVEPVLPPVFPPVFPPVLPDSG